METQQITLVARAHDGKIAVQAEIPVSGDAEAYAVTISVTPQPRTGTPEASLDSLYGALADTPLPEVVDDPLPEHRDEL